MQRIDALRGDRHGPTGRKMCICTCAGWSPTSGWLVCATWQMRVRVRVCIQVQIPSNHLTGIVNISNIFLAGWLTPIGLCSLPDNETPVHTHAAYTHAPANLACAAFVSLVALCLLCSVRA